MTTTINNLLYQNMLLIAIQPRTNILKFVTNGRENILFKTEILSYLQPMVFEILKPYPCQSYHGNNEKIPFCEFVMEYSTSLSGFGSKIVGLIYSCMTK